jgi:cytosine/creatinine deaminase
MPAEVVLRGARFLDGSVGEVYVASGRVVGAVGPGAEVVELEGRLLLPAMAEPHAHLDKAYTADRLVNPAGDLSTAIDVMREGWASIGEDDIVRRATRAVRCLLTAGTTAVRTHSDVNSEIGLRSLRALVAVRDAVHSLMDVQVVGLTGFLTGPDGRTGRKLLVDSIEAGADVLGSCPHIEDDPHSTIEHTLRAASESGLPVDLHFDEVLDAGVQHLTELARRTERHGLGGRVAASHCVSHGMLDPASQRQVARALADAGVAVITNPRTNLFLQARGIEQATPRGMVGLDAMCSEGVALAAGADNVQDPFYVIGRSDPLETASLLIAAAHRSVDEAWWMVSSGARRVMGEELPGFEEASPADFVAIAAPSLREVIADQPADRLVFRGGRLVARTSVESWTADA